MMMLVSGTIIASAEATFSADSKTATGLMKCIIALAVRCSDVVLSKKKSLMVLC